MLLIIDHFENHFLEDLNFHQIPFFYYPDIIREDLLKFSDTTTILLLKSKTNIDKEFLQFYPNLKLVIRAGAGIDHIDSQELATKNIELFTTNIGNASAVAEHAIGLLLSLMANLFIANLEVKNFNWLREENRGFELEGKTVGIYGYGNMGSAFAHKLSGFGANVIAYDKYKSNFSSSIVKEVSLETLFEKTEILSLHLPLTSETKGLFDLTYFSNFQKLRWFLNTARGPIVKTADLIKLLDFTPIQGIALDVLENENFEKLSDSQKIIYKELFNRKNVILTPHIAGWSFESAVKINKLILNKLLDVKS